MKRWTLLFGITAAALVLRSFHLLHGIGIHPDERQMVMVAERLAWTNLDPKFFAYGSLPFYLLFITGEAGKFLFGLPRDYDMLFTYGRSLSIAAGVLLIPLIYCLSLALHKDRLAALFSAALAAFNVFLIQISRFYTVDILLTTLCTACLILAVQRSEGKARRWAVWFGVCWGLALATKITALNLGLLMVLAIFFSTADWRGVFRVRTWLSVLVVIPLAALIFAAAEPYAVLSWQKVLADNLEQIRMVKGDWRPPYIIQYEDTLPLLYPLKQMLLYTLGIPVLFAIFAGLLERLAPRRRPLSSGEKTVLVWAAFVFLSIAAMKVKFPRYLAIIYPVLLAFAGNWIAICWNSPRRGVWRPLRRTPAIVVFSYSIFTALALMSVYDTNHSYTLASQWIFEHVPPGSKLLGVHWDDRLPISLPGYDAPRLYQYEGEAFALPVYEPESEKKLQQMTSQLASSDYLVLPTQRALSVFQAADEFPQTTRMFQLLFTGDLGYRLVRTFKVHASLFGLELPDELADESLSVYDHPKVFIYVNESHLSAQALRERILAPGDRSKPPKEQVHLSRGSEDRL